jgi:outer membrane protein TolC
VNTAETARVTLAAQMGIDPRTPIVPQPTREAIFDDSDVTSLIDLALQVRPEVKEAQATIEADQYGLSAAHSTNAPSISAVTTATQIQVQNFHQNEFTAAIELDWQPLDGGLTQGLIKQAKGSLQVAQDQLRLARNGVISTVATAYLNLRNALQQVATDEISVANAKESLRLQNGRYAAGIGLALDVLDAEQALVTALASQVNDETAVDNARASLIHAMGTPPVSFGAPLGPTDPLITGKGPTPVPIANPGSFQPGPMVAPPYHPPPQAPAPAPVPKTTAR